MSKQESFTRMRLRPKSFIYPTIVILGVAADICGLNSTVLSQPPQPAPPTSVSLSPPLVSVSSKPTQFSDSPKELIGEVWQILERQYIDATFNRRDWKTVGQQYLNREYASKEEAYKAIREMLGQLGDPLTRFMDPKEFKSMQVDPTAAGIGVQLIQDKKTKELVVVSPIEGAPAFTAEILPRDVLVRIDGQSTQGMNATEAAARLRGQAGTPVVLSVRRGQKKLEFRITRTRVEIRPVRYRSQKIAKGEIGYIRFTQFDANPSFITFGEVK